MDTRRHNMTYSVRLSQATTVPFFAVTHFAGIALVGGAVLKGGVAHFVGVVCHQAAHARQNYAAKAFLLLATPHRASRRRQVVDIGLIGAAKPREPSPPETLPFKASPAEAQRVSAKHFERLLQAV